MEQINQPANDPTPRPRLGVWATVGEAYAIWFANLRLWLKLSIVPAIVLIGLYALAPSFLPDPISVSADDMGFGGMLTFTIFYIIVFLAEIPLVTAWHRVVLTRDDAASLRYQVGHREWRYLIKVLLIVLYLCLAILAVGAVMSLLFILPFGAGSDGALTLSPSVAEAMYSIAFLGTYGLIFRFIGHLCLELPAAATGASLSRKEARTALKSNEWRLVSIILLSLVPMLLAEFAVQIWSADGSAIVGMRDLLAYILYFIFTPVVVGVLSIAYRELVETPAAAD